MPETAALSDDVVVEPVAAIDDPALRRELLDLLADAVEGGASVGFHVPFDRELGVDYWQDVSCSLVSGANVLLVARRPKPGTTGGGKLVGAVQLAFSTRQNGRHRAEMQKLMVRRAERRRGVARRLVEAAEAKARKRGIRLIFLDTEAGGEAEPLYGKLGYQKTGTIPDYTVDSDGSFKPTAIYWKRLDT